MPIIDNICDPEFVPWRPQQFRDSSADTILYFFSCLLPANAASTRYDPQRFDRDSRWIPSTLTRPTQEPTSSEASRDLYYLMRLTQLITEKRNNALNYGKILLDDDEWSTDAPPPKD